jgi:hypothetical protein
MDEEDTAEAVLDDVFVLFRALEAAVGGDRDKSIRERIRIAVDELVSCHGIQKLPAVLRWIDQLKYLERASPAQLAEWFADDREAWAAARSERICEIEKLREAAKAPARWNRSDSRRLADVLYSMRCAIIHPSLSTANALALRILPALRRAVVELVVARAAQVGGIALEQARAAFNAPQEAEHV